MATTSDDILLVSGGVALMGWFMWAGHKIEEHYCEWKTREEIKLGIRDKDDEPIRNSQTGMVIGMILFFVVGITIRIFF